MFTNIGQQLRDARLGLGLGIEAVASELCICSRQLRALEENRYDELPGGAYVVGFLRTYARRLGLDADRIVADYKSVYGEAEVKADLHFPEPIRETRIPALSLMAAGVIGLGALYAVWSGFSGATPEEVSIIPSPPAHLAAMIGEESESDRGDSVSAPDQNESPVRQAEVNTPLESTSDAEAATKVAMVAEPAQEAAGADRNSSRSILSSAVAEERAPGLGVQAKGRVQIKATTDTWIMIADKDDRLVMEGIIRAGERYTPPAVPGLRLTATNAGGLELWVDGRSSGELGGRGEIAEDVPLEVERVASAKP